LKVDRFHGCSVVEISEQCKKKKQVEH
jgi:hypothetical protein